MSAWIARLRAWAGSRTPRERGLLLLAGAVVAVAIVQATLIAPLQTRRDALDQEITRLERDFVRATRLASEARRLQAEIGVAESRIAPDDRANLFTLLETLAGETGVKDHLDSIKPKKPGGNARFPETRVEVSLTGVTLAQAVAFLERIETAPRYLIVRSVRLRSRGGEGGGLNVTFSVSTFERA